jgi:hypothetical protein
LHFWKRTRDCSTASDKRCGRGDAESESFSKALHEIVEKRRRSTVAPTHVFTASPDEEDRADGESLRLKPILARQPDGRRYQSIVETSVRDRSPP